MTVDEARELFAPQREHSTNKIYYLHHYADVDDNGVWINPSASHVQINYHIIDDWENPAEWEPLVEKLSAMRHDIRNPCGVLPRFYGVGYKHQRIYA